MAEQPSDGTPSWPGPTDIAARLDRLEQRLGELEGLRATVESALVAQASRIESVLAGVRRDLAGADDRTTEVAAAVERGLAAVTEALADHRASAQEHLRRESAAAAAGIREAGDQVMERVAVRLATAGERMEQAAATVAGVPGALDEHLGELERRGSVERARLAQAFAEQLADGLSRRERRRLARRLEVPEPQPATDVRPTPLPVSSSTPPVASMEPPADEVAASAPTREAADTAEDRLMADDVPAWDPTPAIAPDADHVPSSRTRVQSSRRDRPRRRTASDSQDPAAVRRALAAVRGLGPARQSALIDRFGTLDAIRDASDEQLLAVPGIGPALLPGIRNAVA